MGILRRILVWLLLAAIGTSCAVVSPDQLSGISKKEQRKMKRATRKVERAKEIWPGIVEGRVEMRKIDVRVPEIIGHIVQQPGPGHVIVLPGDVTTVPCIELPAQYTFADSLVTISVVVHEDGSADMSYQIKERTVSTLVEVRTDTIQPVQVQYRTPWYIWVLVAAMALTILVLALRQ